MILMAATCVACGGPNPSLYLLPPSPDGATPTASLAIALREVALPSYARDARLAERQATGAIVHLDEHRWADAPARTVTRTLARHLQAETGRLVVVEPWAAQINPAATVAITVDVFDGARGGRADMRGRVTVHTAGAAPEARLQYLSFSISTPVRGTAFTDVMQAFSTNLATLAKQIKREALP